MNWLLKITGLGKLWGALAAVGVILAGIGAIFLRGRSAGLKTARTKQMEKNDETRKRIDKVKPAGRDGTVDRLRDRKHPF